MSNDLDIALKLSAQTDGFNKGVDGAKSAVNALVAAMAALGVGLTIKGLIDTADAYTTLQSKIKLAVGDTGNFQQAMDGVAKVALETNSNLDDTGSLFAIINKSAKELNLTQQQALDLTKTINQAVKIGGGSAEASSAAVTQLTQSLQSGVFRGDEFNSVMEQAPGISKAIATSLGVTTGELRNMSQQGQLTAQVVVKALQDQSSAINEDYGKVTLTVGQALQRISTSWTIFIGETDQANGSSHKLAEMLANVADNLDLLKPFIDDAISGFGYLYDKMSNIDPGILDALKVAAASAYDTLKDLIKLVADGFERTVEQTDNVLKGLLSFMTTTEQAKEGVSGFKKALDLVNITLGLLDDGFNAIGIAAKLLQGGIYDLGASFLVLRSYFSFGAEKDQFIADAKEMSEKASQYYGDAQKDLMNFQSSTEKAGIEANKTQKQLNDDKVLENKATLDKIIADEESASKEKIKTNTDSLAKIKDLEDQLNKARKDGSTLLVESLKKDIAAISDSEQKAAKDKIDLDNAKLAAAQNYADAAIKANAGVLTGVMQIDLASKGFIATQTEVGAVSVKAFGDTAKAGLDAAQSLKSNATAAIVSLGIDLQQAATGISKSFNASLDQVNNIASGIKELGYTAQQSGNVIYTALADVVSKAKTKEELELVRLKFIELGKDGKLSSDLVAGGLALVSDQLTKVKGDIDPVSAAFKELGIQTKEQLKLASLAAQAAFDVVRKSGLATADDLQKAAEKNMQLATASGDASVIASAKAQAAQAGLIVTIDDTGKSIVQTNAQFVDSSDEATSSTHRLAQGYRDAGNAGVNAADAVRQAWAKAKAEQDAAFENHGKDVGNALNGAGLQAYNVKDVTDKLTALGFSIADATAKATVLVRDANQNLIQHQGKGSWFGDGGLSAYDLTNGASLDAEIQKIGAQKAQDDARSAGGGVLLGSSGLADQTTASSNLNQNAMKTVKYNITIGGQTATLYGDAGSEDQTNALLSQLEMLKKGSA